MVPGLAEEETRVEARVLVVLEEARAPVVLEEARLAGQMEESGVMVAEGPNRYMPIVRGIEVLTNARITG